MEEYLTNTKRLGRYHNVPCNNSNNDKPNPQSHFNKSAFLHKGNSRKPLLDWDKPLFGRKGGSLQKLLANARHNNRGKSIAMHKSGRFSDLHVKIISCNMDLIIKYINM
jgi:hypothetical protein